MAAAAGVMAVAGSPVDRHDRARLRRTRRRHAATATAHERLPRTIADHLMEHLEPIRLDPARVLQVGGDAGGLARRLGERFPKARLLMVDDCMPALRQAVPRARWSLRRRAGAAPVCASPCALPLPGASVDLACSNLAPGLLADDVAPVLAQCRRVLRHGALLMLSFVGPDSFRELREAWSAVDRHAHLHRYLDLHEMGDALVRAGFRDVVVDVERLHAEFDDVDHLLRELRALAGGYTGPGRRPGLLSVSALRRVHAAYPASATGAPVRATLEIGYAHAWVLDPPGVEVSLPGDRPTPRDAP